MCFHTKQSAETNKLVNRFKAVLKNEKSKLQSEHYNGFEHPETPVITNTQPNEIQLFQWGLIPPWAKDTQLQNNTLNARIETLREKPSFSVVTHQRCLVLLDGFYEWQWLDPKGKKKQQYLITREDGEPFAVAGLWSQWVNPAGSTVNSYTIITTEARGIIREIHNSKLRMPVILQPDCERDWLGGKTTAKLFTTLVGIRME